MKNLIQNKKKGFTLIELVLVVGLIAIAIIAIYNVYNKKKIQTLVKNQTIYLSQLNNGINGSFATATDYALLTPANAIASRIVPTPMVESATVIRNVFGGTINFSGTNGASPTFSIILSDIPENACALLATTDFADNTRQVKVNNSPIKANGAVASATSVTTAITLCANNTNTLEFTNLKEQVSEIEPVLNPIAIRTKEDPYHIPTAGTPVASPSVSCAGGSSWNGSFCGCPANSEWNGAACIVYGSKPGACPIGQGWNGTTCVIHSLGGPGGTYMGGRNIPNLAYSPNQVQQITPGQVCSSTSGNYDNINCQTCVVGSWNGFRCVTP